MVSWGTRFPREDNSGLIPRKHQTALRSVSLPNLPPSHILQPVALGPGVLCRRRSGDKQRGIFVAGPPSHFFSHTRSDLRPAFFVHCSRVLIDGIPTWTSRSTSSSPLGKNEVIFFSVILRAGYLVQCPKDGVEYNRMKLNFG